MTIKAAFLDQLKQIAGPKGWIDQPGDMESFVAEARGRYQGRTPLILLPDTTEKVAAIVAFCAEHKIPVVPQGGNSSLVAGSIPRPDGQDIVISLRRMNRIRNRDQANRTMTVEAGCILAHIQDAARSMDCLFPLSLAAEGSCMIGGNLSTNAGGINVLQYGSMRQLVLGLEVVLPQGDIWHGLSGLRKDNTGYDLKQIFIGAEGTLGIITAATLTLFPWPHEQQTALVAVPDPAAAVALLGLARATSGDCLTAFELIPRVGLDMVTAHMPDTRNPLVGDYAWYVLLECRSSLSPDLLNLEQVMERLLSRALEKDLLYDGVIAKNQTESRNLWSLRENIPEAQKFEGGSLKHDIALPISALAAFMAEAEQQVSALMPEARPVVFGHLGDGNLHYNISQPSSGDYAFDRAAFFTAGQTISQKIYDMVVDFGGSFSAEHGIGRLKVDDMIRYKTATEIRLMQQIKHGLDPETIMNPGVIVKP